MGKPVVWTMHDMWNCTGICHHAYDCTRYKKFCGECKYLNSDLYGDLSYRTRRKKKELYEMPNLHFVAVSNWLAGKCAESSLLRYDPIKVIPNTMPVETFSYNRKPNEDYHLPADVKVIAMGAARLDDAVKGFDLLIDTTRHIKQYRPELAQKLHLLLFGDIRDASLLQKLAIPYMHLGRVSNDDVRDIMVHSDIVLSTSLYESFGGTLVEGLASGCVPVTFGNGGQTDIVDHMETYHNEKCAVLCITEDLCTRLGVDMEELDGVAGLPLQIQGMEVAVTMKEKKPGVYKISMRSAGKINVSRICQQLGGGGHVNAAGCLVTGGLDDAKAQIVEVVGKALGE
jgi:glycosyltransferase involved in cell wall biosynthesis